MNKLFVVENHHEVLVPWSEWRIRTGSSAPQVLVLDHHTDVLPAFRDASIPVEQGAWRNPDKVRCAVAQLHHDEHFDWAVRSGLITGCDISSHVNATQPSVPQLKIHCDSRWQDENHVFADPEKFRSLVDSVLESSYLSAIFGDTLPEHFILDIDCDYFSTERSFHPKDLTYFRKMVEKAQLITVSLERDWVRILRFSGEKFNEKDIVSQIQCFCRML